MKIAADWFVSLRRELGAGKLAANLVSGGLMGVTEVFVAISFATLIFSGSLSISLSFGIGAALFSAALILILSALFTSAPGMVASLQDSATVLLALIAAQLAADTQAANPQDRLATVFVGIGFAVFLTGVCMFLIGAFKLGGLVRYIPYPVVGGFLAGTGLLLVQGSFGAMADYPLQAAYFQQLQQPDQLILWLPGVFFAAVLVFGLRWIRHSLAMPALLVALLLLFFVGLLVSGTSIAEANQMGLLLGGGGVARWMPLSTGMFAQADWGAILRRAGDIGVLIAISLVSLLLNTTGLELILQKDADLDKELRVSGLANLLSGLGGGIIGFHAISLSALMQRVGGRGRLPGVIAGAVSLVMGVAGTALLAFFPRAILGGLLLFLGVEFLIEWVFQGWRRFSRLEYAVVLLIAGVIFFTDFLIGVGVGLVVMIVMFVVSYSRISAVRYTLRGDEIHSNVERSALQRQALHRYGDQIHVMALEGFLFFGSVSSLLERVRTRINAADQPPLRFLLFDFKRVSGMDSSAALIFSKVRQLTDSAQIRLALSDVSQDFLARLDLPELSTNEVRIFPDLDRAIESCEQAILEDLGLGAADLPADLLQLLEQDGLAFSLTHRLVDYLEACPLEPGDYLIHQDAQSDAMFYIVSGRVSVYLERPPEAPARLRSLLGGSSVGEVGLYLNQPRLASVIADEPSLAYRLSREALDRMRMDDPDLAAAFHAMIARQLSEILTMNTRTVEALLRS